MLLWTNSNEQNGYDPIYTNGLICFTIDDSIKLLDDLERGRMYKQLSQEQKILIEKYSEKEKKKVKKTIIIGVLSFLVGNISGIIIGSR